MAMTKRQILKSIIKEAVREVIHEDMRSIIKEELKLKDKPKLNEDFIYKDFLPKPLPSPRSNTGTKPAINPVKTNDPIANLIQQTARNLSSDEFKTISMNSDMVGAQGFIPPMANSFSQDLGEIEEWTPTNVKFPAQ